MIRTLIVDDERLARKELHSLLRPFPEIKVIGECGNAEEATDKIQSLQPDLIFLDIQMPGKNGFQMLQELERVPEVIFVTAFDEFAIKAFEISALDYLMKPVDEKRLKSAIQKILIKNDAEDSGNIVNTEELSLLSENDQVFVKDGEKCWFVYLREIRLFESEGNYVKVHFGNQHPLVLKSLNNLDQRLDQRVFFRANRKHVINLRWVENVENWFNGGLKVKLKGGEQIEISRRQAVRLREKMSL